MAISANLQQSLITAGLGILGANHSGANFGQAVGQGGLMGLQAYQQGAEKEAAQLKAQQQQEALQGAVSGLSPELQQLAIAYPEMAANILAKQNISQFEQDLAAKAPISPLDKAKLGLQERGLDATIANQQANQLEGQERLNLAKQNLQFQREKQQQDINATYQQLAQKQATEGQLKPTDIAGMRKEFTAQSKDFIAVRDSYNKVKTSASSATPVADISTIFAYMKMLDPTSVVREGEQATAANARAVPDTIRNLYNRITEGTKLTPEQRQQFTQEAENLMNSYMDTHMQLRDEYSQLATSFNADPNQVVVDYLPKEDKTQKASNAISFEEYFK